MPSLIDSKMPVEQQEQAKRILVELKVTDVNVHFDKKNQVLVFERDRRVVSIPTKLIEQELWSDIRFLFRATLNPQNSIWNRTADENDWSGNYHYE